MNDSSSLSSDLLSSDLIYFSSSSSFRIFFSFFFPIFLISFPYLSSSSLRWSNLHLSSSHPGSKDGRHGNGSHHIWNGWTVYGICHCWSYEYVKGIFPLFLSPLFFSPSLPLFISCFSFENFPVDLSSKTWPPFTPNHSLKPLKFPEKFHIIRRKFHRIPWKIPQKFCDHAILNTSFVSGFEWTRISFSFHILFLLRLFKFKS